MRKTYILMVLLLSPTVFAGTNMQLACELSQIQRRNGEFTNILLAQETKEIDYSSEGQAILRVGSYDFNNKIMESLAHVSINRAANIADSRVSLTTQLKFRDSGFTVQDRNSYMVKISERPEGLYGKSDLRIKTPGRLNPLTLRCALFKN